MRFGEVFAHISSSAAPYGTDKTILWEYNMKRLCKNAAALGLLLSLALTLGLAGCGETSFSVQADFDAVRGKVSVSSEGKGEDGK